MSQERSNNLAVVVPFEGREVQSYRRSVEHHLELSLAMAKQARRRVSIFCIRFTSVSDRPHKAGREVIDELPAKLQQQLSDLAPAADQVGQLWQDGLAIVHYLAQDSFDIYRSAKRLLLTFERLLQSGRDKLAFKMSLGIALYPDDGNTPSALLNHAYAAAERADCRGKNGFCFYSRSVGREVADRLSMYAELSRALKTDAVDMHFQPIVDIRRDRMIGVNGKPAWSHPERGYQSEGEIMHAVEHLDLAQGYNAWLIERVCQLIDQWSGRSRQQRIEFSATRSQLVNTALATRLSGALHTYNVPAHLIDVAVDGKLLVDETDHRLRTGLQQLADLGFQLTVANIGIESLPLEGLKKLPLKAVELAPAMVSTIGRCTASERTLTALVSFVKTLGFRIRAVDVMTESQLDFLRKIHCDEVAGPLLAPPMQGEDIDRLTEIQLCGDWSRGQGTAEQRLINLH